MGGVYTKVQDPRSLRAGDHIAIWDFSLGPIAYQHHGLAWASGDTPAEIKICHVWSPLEVLRDAQADAYFRISTLEQFLSKRGLPHLRLVEYHTSGLREILSRWGEVHLTKRDPPEVVLARCKFLLGLGRGDFEIFKQNCEHAAHWCMNGDQWCKQNLTRGKGRVPFEKSIPTQDVDALEKEIDQIKMLSKSVVESVLQLSGTRVYLRVNGNQYVSILPSGQVCIVAQGDGEPAACKRTAFRLECYSKVYNCVKVSFFHEESRCYLFSRSTFSCFRDLRMKKALWVRGKTGLKWEYACSGGTLTSMNQHRRYIGVQESDGVLVDVGMRGQAARVEFISEQKSQFETPDIDKITRSFDHASAVARMKSRSMCEFEEDAAK